MLKTKGFSIRKNNEIIKNAIALLVVLVVSIFSSQSRVGGFLSFVNVAVTALSGIMGVFSFFASTLTYIILGVHKEAVVQLSAMIIIVGVKLILQKKLTIIQNSVLTSSALLFCSLVASAVNRTSGYLFVYRMIFSLLCGCMVYFASKTGKQISADKKLNLYGMNGATVGVIYTVLIATFCTAGFSAFNIGRTLGIFITLIIAKKYRITGGGICGAITSFGVIMYSPELAKNTLFLCACGIVSGAVAGLGNIAMSAGFIVTAVLGLVATGLGNDTFSMLTDIAVASTLFIAMPKETESFIMKLFTKAKKRGSNSVRNTSKEIDFTAYALSDVKNRLDEISKALEKNNKASTESELYAKEKSQLLRELLTEQLSITESLLNDMSDKTNALAKANENLSQKVVSLFSRFGHTNSTACVIDEDNGAIKVEAFLTKEPKFDMVKFTVELSAVLDTEMDLPVSVTQNGVTKLVFCQSAQFKISSGVVQKASKEGDYCGDTLDRIWLSSTQYMVILSDGMGTGKRARLDSSFTANLISRFTACGVSVKTALKLINSILRVKGWDESFATADISLFDLCEGTVKFIKSGASPSYIIRDGAIIRIDGQAFPLGILTTVTPAEYEYKLFDGDRVIITSDGVDENSVRKAVKEITDNHLNSKQSAEIIAEYVKEYSAECKNDDISVCVSDVFSH